MKVNCKQYFMIIILIHITWPPIQAIRYSCVWKMLSLIYLPAGAHKIALQTNKSMHFPNTSCRFYPWRRYSDHKPKSQVKIIKS